MITENITHPKRRRRKGSIPSFEHIPRRLYPLDEAAAYLGRTVWAVREMIWAGKFPHVKDGKRILVDVLDMDAWIISNKQRFTP